MGTLALIEVLDRDGTVRQAEKVVAWPLRVGRALDNDLVLDDPHVAPHHFRVGPNEDGLVLTVGDTRNGVTVGAQHLAATERWQAGVSPFTVVAGRTHLRLRLAEHALAPERPLAESRVFGQRLMPLFVLFVLNLLAIAFDTYLTSDPEPFLRQLARDLLSGVGVMFAWCGLWTLLSKLFTRQGHFLWHVRVLLTSVLVWELLDGLIRLTGFALSWPWLTGHAYLPGMAIAAIALQFHLQAVEPHRPVATRAFAAAAFVVGLGLTVWGSWQRLESTRSELYQAVMFPPAARLAAGRDLDSFVTSLQPLQESLDAKAKKPADEDDAGADGDEDAE